MRNELWRLLITETFIKSWDELLLLAIPVLLALIVFIGYRRKPLGADGAWTKCGQRFMILGQCFLGGVLLVYLVTATVSYARRTKENARYTESLQNRFKEYYFARKNFTQRLQDFANRIPDNGEIVNVMDSFAYGLPDDEREFMIIAWVTSKKAGHTISQAESIAKLSDILYWPSEKVEEFRKKNRNHNPAATAVKYTPEQIAEFKKSNWPKLYSMLTLDQWRYIKNEIFDFDKTDRDRVLSFLRDIADAFQRPPSRIPTASLEEMYETMSNKACSDNMQKVEFYLEDAPKMLSFYKFSLKHRWWVRGLPLVVILGLMGLIMVINGHKLVVEGKKKNFK